MEVNNNHTSTSSNIGRDCAQKKKKMLQSLYVLETAREGSRSQGKLNGKNRLTRFNWMEVHCPPPVRITTDVSAILTDMQISIM